jgi:hypothetical protein
MSGGINRLTHLEISEVSLVDKPANQEFGIPRARIAIWKRDDGSTNAKETKHMKLKQILKSATVTRQQIVEAVRAKAVKISKRDGCSYDQAEARVWERNPEVYRRYERAARPALAKVEKRFAQQTQAEATIDDLSRRRIRKTGESYAQAMTATLEQDPSLYESFQKEHAAGETYDLPVPSEYSGTTLPHSDGKRVKGSSMVDTLDDLDDEDEDEDDLDNDDNGKRKHSPADALGSDHTMYARRTPTASGDMTGQERSKRRRA